MVELVECDDELTTIDNPDIRCGLSGYHTNDVWYCLKDKIYETRDEYKLYIPIYESVIKYLKDSNKYDRYINVYRYYYNDRNDDDDDASEILEFITKDKYYKILQYYNSNKHLYKSE